MDTYAIKLKEDESLSRYADTWVALSPETREVICSSQSAKEVHRIAVSKGESDPILTRVPKRFDSYIL